MLERLPFAFLLTVVELLLPLGGSIGYQMKTMSWQRRQKHRFHLEVYRVNLRKNNYSEIFSSHTCTVEKEELDNASQHGWRRRNLHPQAREPR